MQPDRLRASPVAQVSGELTEHLQRYAFLWIAAAVSVAAAVWGLHTGIGRLLVRWNYPYDHGWLVVGMCAWLVARRLRDEGVPRVAPSACGLLALAVAVGAYAIAEVLDVSIGMTFMLPLLVLAGVAALAGLSVARAAAVPLALLYLAVPLWDYAVPVLQRLAVAAVTAALSVAGPPAYVTGNVIVIPAGSFEVADGCSGIRFFMVSLTLAAFYGLNWYRRWRTRWILLAVAAVAALVSNWVRIYSLVLIGQVTNMQHYLIAVSHEKYGWVVSAIFLMPVLWFARRMERYEAAIESGSPVQAAVAAVAPAWQFVAAGAAAALLFASPVLLRAGRPAGLPDTLVVALGTPPPGWQGTDPSPEWQPQFSAPYLQIREGFSREGLPRVDVFVARYLRQQPGSKLIATKNRLNTGWNAKRAGSRQVEFAGAPRQISEEVIEAGDGRQRLVWHWYSIGGLHAHRRLSAKLLEVVALVRGRRDGTVVALSSPCERGCASAAGSLALFLQAMDPRFDAVSEGALDSPHDDKT